MKCRATRDEILLHCEMNTDVREPLWPGGEALGASADGPGFKLPQHQATVARGHLCFEFISQCSHFTTCASRHPPSTLNATATWLTRHISVHLDAELFLWW